MSPKLKNGLIGVLSTALAGALALLAAPEAECPVCAPCPPVEAIGAAPVDVVVPAPVLSPDAEKAPLEGGAILDAPAP